MVLLVCAALAACYLLGGRSPVHLANGRRRWGKRHWRTTAFLLGLAICAASTSGPGDAFSRESFSTRTVQLMLLVMLVAPLLVLGAPRLRFLRLFGLHRQDTTPPLVVPILALVVFSAAILVAYLPPVYHATADPGWPRTWAQLSMIGLGYAYWSQVIAQPPRHGRLSQIGRVAYLLLSSTQLRILGVVLGFAPASFYGVPLVDQQVAAGIVMVPGVFTDLIVLTVCLYLWLGQEDHPALRHSGSQLRWAGRQPSRQASSAPAL